MTAARGFDCSRRTRCQRAAVLRGAGHPIPNRWTILGILLFARCGMAFQFQSVAALSPFLSESYGFGLAEIWLLIGLYLAPGVVVAIPGGAIAERFGDKRVVAVAIGLMLAGALLVAIAPNWSLLVGAQVIAGIGGVIVNVVLTKLLVDWFLGREISTAMAIFVNSWPIGIALALLVLPATAANGGLEAAYAVISTIIVAGLALFGLLYRAPNGAEPAGATLRVGTLPVAALIAASLVQAFYNVALAMIFSFGPEALIARGWDLTEAGRHVSAFMVVFSVFLPLGGVVADATGRRDTVIAVSLLSYLGLFLLIPSLPIWGVWAVVLAVAVFFGLAAGPIMTLPSAVLPPEARSFGMGVFFSIYYLGMMAASPLAGGIADRSGVPATAIVIGAVFLALALVSLALFRPLAARPVATSP